VALVVERVRVGGPRRARSRVRRLPVGVRHGGGAAQSGTAQRRPGRPARLPPQGSLRRGGSDIKAVRPEPGTEL
jgi:hypothetical protein